MLRDLISKTIGDWYRGNKKWFTAAYVVAFGFVCWVLGHVMGREKGRKE